MLKPDYDVVAIGNAIIDVLAHVDDRFLDQHVKEHGLVKGGMTLIERDLGKETLASMKDPIIKSGGSASNMVLGVTSFGGKCAFIGKVAGDYIGEQFSKSLCDEGVVYNTAPYDGDIDVTTGRSFILITPDGIRTMNTYLGANRTLSEEDIDEELVSSARYLYLEGYLFDRELAKKAFIYAADISKRAERKVVLNLSDPACVRRHSSDFLEFVTHNTDILFATEKEIKELYGVKTVVDAINASKEKCEITVITRSEKGSVVVSNGEVIEIEGRKIEVVDTTGAGDQYAAGFLYGLIRDVSLKACGRLGTAAASKVISHIGAQPQGSYATLIVKELMGSLGE